MIRIGVGDEVYASFPTLRRGYVHQVIHNNFHTGGGSALTGGRAVDSALRVLEKGLAPGVPRGLDSSG